MSEAEIRFYKSKKLSLPKRCKDCREENKKNKTDDTRENHKKKSNQEKASFDQKNKKPTENLNVPTQEKAKEKPFPLIPVIVGGVALIAVVVVLVLVL